MRLPFWSTSSNSELGVFVVLYKPTELVNEMVSPKKEKSNNRQKEPPKTYTNYY